MLSLVDDSDHVGTVTGFLRTHSSQAYFQLRLVLGLQPLLESSDLRVSGLDGGVVLTEHLQDGVASVYGPLEDAGVQGL
ncbi:hypothetical protein D3C71_1890880 [compost metagenome]